MPLVTPSTVTQSAINNVNKKKREKERKDSFKVILPFEFYLMSTFSMSCDFKYSKEEEEEEEEEER